MESCNQPALYKSLAEKKERAALPAARFVYYSLALLGE